MRMRGSCGLALAARRKLNINSEQKRMDVLTSQITTIFGFRTRSLCLISIDALVLRLARMVALGQAARFSFFFAAVRCGCAKQPRDVSPRVVKVFFLNLTALETDDLSDCRYSRRVDARSGFRRCVRRQIVRSVLACPACSGWTISRI